MGSRPSLNLLYSERRYSFVVLVAVIIALVALGFVVLLYDDIRIMWFGAPFVLLSALLTFTANISIWGDGVSITYGIGLVSDEVHYNAMRTIVVGPNRSPKAWIYSPFSTDVVSITLRDDSQVALPTNNPRRVHDLIRARMESHH